jgi:hypothetical protein
MRNVANFFRFSALATGLALASSASAGPLDAISVITERVTIDVQAGNVRSIGGAGATTPAASGSVGNTATLTNVGGVTQIGSSYLGGRVTVKARVGDVTNVGSTVNVGGVVQGARQK